MICDEETRDHASPGLSLAPCSNIKLGNHAVKAFFVAQDTLDPMEALARCGNTIGRTNEVILFLRALYNPLNNRSSTIYVEGGKGVGKTHLVSRFWQIANGTFRYQSYYVATEHSDQHVDFSVFAQLFQRICGPNGDLFNEDCAARKRSFCGFLQEHCSLDLSDPRLPLLNFVFHRYHNGLGFPKEAQTLPSR